VSPETLLALLGVAVIIGLFLYLKFFLFVAVVLLIAGANMPEQIAEGLNISKVPIVLALVALVGVGLINYVVKVLPTGLEPKPKEKSPEGIRALFYAIEKSNLVYAQKVLSMNFDPNLLHDNGYTPLAYAAMKGSVPMVELLLRNGASASLTTREGDTAVELALRYGHADAAELLKRARQEAEAVAAAETVPQAGT
jgi:ankyrin repeat protein